MRVKVFAVVPALLVLVSLCGSPVPPPPGTVIGAVFFDEPQQHPRFVRLADGQYGGRRQRA